MLGSGRSLTSYSTVSDLILAFPPMAILEGKEGASLSTDLSCLPWRDLVKLRINETRLGKGYSVGKGGKCDCLNRFRPDLIYCL